MNAHSKQLQEKLWAAADKMRGNMDPSEYKHVVLGLIFLKYISDSFKQQHEKILKEEGVDTRDFFVPIHRQPVFTSMKLFAGETYPVSDDLSTRGFYIPSGLALTDEQQKQVIQTIRGILR